MQLRNMCLCVVGAVGSAVPIPIVKVHFLKIHYIDLSQHTAHYTALKRPSAGCKRYKLQQHFSYFNFMFAVVCVTLLSLLWATFTLRVSRSSYPDNGYTYVFVSLC